MTKAAKYFGSFFMEYKMSILSVKANRKSEYEIVISQDYSDLSEKFTALFSKGSKVCIVTDTNVSKHYLDKIAEILSKDYKVISTVLPAGEPSKSFESVKKIMNLLIKEQFSRNDVLIGLGGGVMGDLTGFCASIYKRGIPFVLLPTTLLSMVDSSIGGKTAVDFDGIKNVVGSFFMPSLVYASTDALKTLPEREYYAGFAEIMKAGLLYDEDFYVWLIDNMYEICEKKPETLAEMIETAVNIKRAIVEKDPFEKGDRALLNLGHTIGHGIESFYAGEYLHGECVALGTVAAAFISWKMNMIPMEEYYEIRDMFVPFNLPISVLGADPRKILKLLYNDKKNSDGKINMVLLKKIGKAVLVKDIDEKLILDAIDELIFKEED